VVAIAIAAAWPYAAQGLAAVPPTAAPVLPAVAAQPGWTAHAPPREEWRPHYSGQRALLHERYAGAGREVGLFLPYYRGQIQGRELVNSQNVVVHPSDPRWRAVSRAHASLPWGADDVPVTLTEVAGPDGRWMVADFYWVGGRTTTSEYVAALLVLAAKLSGRGDDAAAVVLYTPVGESPRAASAALAAFAAEHGAAIERALNGAGRP
jgi:EpsI family protein